MEQLWVDQYRPKKLDDFIYNLEAVETFQKLAKNSTDIPHLIIEGITGIGKKGIAMAFIRECLDKYGIKGDEIYKTHNMEINFKYTNKNIDLNIQKSLYHYNLNPSDYGIYDRHIVQDFLTTQFKYKFLTGFPYKTVIIRSAENLSLDAQQSLRRTLENCIKNCRFIFLVNTEKQGTLIPALNSRCIKIRMSAPSKEDAYKVIKPILIKNNINTISDGLIEILYKKCQGNISHTINLLQLMYTIYEPEKLSALTTINLQDICPITKCCNDIVTELFASDNLNMITKIRTNLYTLLTHGVNAEDIIKRIFKIVIINLKGWEIKVIELTDEIELMLRKSSREFYHIENYIVRLLILIKQYQIKDKSPVKNKSTSVRQGISTIKPSTIKVSTIKPLNELNQSNQSNQLNLSNKSNSTLVVTVENSIKRTNESINKSIDSDDKNVNVTDEIIENNEKEKIENFTQEIKIIQKDFILEKQMPGKKTNTSKEETTSVKPMETETKVEKTKPTKAKVTKSVETTDVKTTETPQKTEVKTTETPQKTEVDVKTTTENKTPKKTTKKLTTDKKEVKVTEKTEEVKATEKKEEVKATEKTEEVKATEKTEEVKVAEKKKSLNLVVKKE